jgi:hypothetical protein
MRSSSVCCLNVWAGSVVYYSVVTSNDVTNYHLPNVCSTSHAAIRFQLGYVAIKLHTTAK